MQTSLTQIIGIGAAGLSIAVAADKEDRFTELLEAGIVFIDKSDLTNIDSQSLNYYINSNSSALGFLSSIREDGIFKEVFDSEIVKKIRSYGENILPLNLIAQFLRLLAEKVKKEIESYPKSKFIIGTEVKFIKINQDGCYESFDENNNLLATSTNLVIATGAYCKDKKHLNLDASENFILKNLESCRWFVADDMMRCESTTDFEKILKDKVPDKFILVGGSFSAFAIAHQIKNLNPPLSEKSIYILHRREIQLYFDSEYEAKECNYTFDDANDKIDPQNGAVNRFCGLRGDAKNLYLSIKNGEENQVILINGISEKPEDIEKKIGEINCDNTIIIVAIGYESRRIKIIDFSGQEVNFGCSQKGIVKVDEYGRILNDSHTAIQGLFGIGIGYPRKLDEHEERCDRIGVNIFQGMDAPEILRKILD
ncbi:MAG: FAD-dependent oxidoreductase [Cyanobacteriota bacterium]|nr:FAD-dependent oxidoreductase [Cyanobacteriota bacterium]